MRDFIFSADVYRLLANTVIAVFIWQTEAYANNLFGSIALAFTVGAAAISFISLILLADIKRMDHKAAENICKDAD